MIRILLVEDHRMMREGLRALLASDPDIKVVAEATHGKEALEALRNEVPDVVIMDLSMPDMNGLETTAYIRKQYPSVRVLVLTQHESEKMFLDAIRAGATGYIRKASAAAELLQAIRIVAAGNAYLSPEVALLAVNILVRGGLSDPVQILSPREQEILECLSEGESNKEIGKKLYISAKTVQTHRENILRKLKFNSQGELIKYALNRRNAKESL